MDGGAWKAAVHGVAEGWTRLTDFPFTFHFHALEKEMATHPSVLAWSGLPFPSPMHESEMATHSSVLAWRIPGTGSLVGCHLWGRTESDTTEVT